MNRSFGWLLIWSLAAGQAALAQAPQPFLDFGYPGAEISRLPSVGPLVAPEAVVPEEELLVPDAGDVLSETEFAEAEVDRPPTPPPKIWEGSFELGINGSEGNSQTFNSRFGADLKRESQYHVLSADFDYRRDSNNSIETANRAFLDWKAERLFQESPWTWFVHGTLDYDEFQAFDLRIAVDTGLGYRIIETDTLSLSSRFGGGFSHEIGGPDDSYVPEMVFGLDLDYQLTERQKITAKADYTPDVTNFGDFRLISDVGWQILLDEEMNLSLKASMLDRYDSTPNGARPNDLDYALTLLWSF